ncbi:hypothetical protein [Thermovenabulum gondwanense]|uniref:Uncharacterized protein n=1 Tax=Thermovenabulum gondwanense TaxID=520767 RepID=A0A162MRF5_9FIRM|nr:hypothetical protein [Thermovenabulum gondwanense]KYO67001.1 hypothetical protein ATZ99_08180 [Thermovenabulum gondwanense]
MKKKEKTYYDVATNAAIVRTILSSPNLSINEIEKYIKFFYEKTKKRSYKSFVAELNNGKTLENILEEVMKNENKNKMIDFLKVFVPDKNINEQIDNILKILSLEQELSRLFDGIDDISDIADDELLSKEELPEELFENVSLDAADLIGDPIRNTSPEIISSEIFYRNDLKKFTLRAKITGKIDLKKNLLSVNHIICEIYKKEF